MPFVDLDNVKMYYEVRGKGIPLLILPGFGLDNDTTIATFEPNFQHREGWLRIYPDMPGTGKTPKMLSNNTADNWLTCIISFITKIIGNTQFTLAGISYGAYLARGVLLHYFNQVLGIFLGIPCIIPDKQHRILPTLRAIEKDLVFLTSLPTEERKPFEEIATIQTRGVWERFKNIILKSMEHTDWTYLNQLQERNYAFSFDVDKNLAPFDGPSLIITGRQDNMCGYRDAWALIEKFPRATFVVLDRASHCLELEQETVYNVLISEWLDRVLFASKLVPAPERTK